jgi:hypothetical protein
MPIILATWEAEIRMQKDETSTSTNKKLGMVAYV